MSALAGLEIFHLDRHVEKRENNLVENFEENHPFAKLIQILRKREGDMAIEHVRIQATNDVWKVLVDICLQASVNSNVWKKNYKGNELSSFVTPYDETFALLALENNYEDWIYLVLNDGKREKGKDLTLYNIRGKSKPDRNRKGYSLQGKKRFNAILKVVVEQRKDQESKKKEESLPPVTTTKSSPVTSSVIIPAAWLCLACIKIGPLTHSPSM